MGAFVMEAVVERLADNAPLHREIAAATKIMRAVDRPAQGAMIDDHFVDVFRVECIVTAFGSDCFILIAKAKAKIAHDDIGRVLDLKGKISQGDAIPGGGLAGDRDI